MKKWIVLFVLLILSLGVFSAALCETVKMETDMQLWGEIYSEQAAYLRDEEGTIWTWRYENSAPEKLCTLPELPRALAYGEKTYQDLADGDKALVKQTAQILVADADKLYAVNQYEGLIGTVGPNGIDWLDTRIDTAYIMLADGQQRFVMKTLMKDGMLYMLADNSNESANSSKLLQIDIASGKTVAYDTQDAKTFCFYGDQVALLCSDWEGSNWINLMERSTGTITALDKSVPSGYFDVFCYDEAQGAFYIAKQQSIYAQKGNADFVIVASMPDYISSLYVFSDSRLAMGCGGISVMPKIDLDSPRQVLTLSNSFGDQTTFMKAHPDVLIDTQDQYLTAAQVADCIRSGDTKTDIFQVRVDHGFGELVKKGYAATLDDNALISASVASMYPQISKAIVNQAGQIVAYPQDLDLNLWDMKLELWDKHFPGESVPTTWKGLFEAMLRFEEMDDTDGDLFLMEWSYESMINAVLNAYIVQYSQSETQMQFDTDALREALEALAKVNEVMMQKGIDYLFEGDVYYDSETVGGRSIFHMGAGGFSTYKYKLDSFGALEPFAFIEGETPVIRAHMNALIVNPLSQNQDLAKDYISMLTPKESNIVRYYMLHQNAIEPYENEDWEAKMSSLEEEKQTLETRIAAEENADNKRDLEIELENVQRHIEWSKEDQYLISAEAIADWQTVAARLNCFEDGIYLSEAMTQQLGGIVTRYAQRQIDLSACVKQLDEVSQRVIMEQ